MIIKLFFLNLVFSICQSFNCNQLYNLSDKYNCDNTSFLASFAYNQCLNHQNYYMNFQNSQFIQQINTCVYNQIQDSLNRITQQYNNNVTCQNLQDIGINSYTNCFSNSQNYLNSYCQFNNQDKYQYIKMTYQNLTKNSLQYWDQIINNFDGLTSGLVTQLASYQKTNPPIFVKKRIEQIFLNKQINIELTCPVQYVQNYLEYLIGNYSNLKNLIIGKQNIQQKQKKSSQMVKIESTTACRNFTNLTIQNQKNYIISMSGCPSIFLQNLIIRNNRGISFYFTNSGAVIIKNVTVQNNSYYDSSRGLFSFSSITSQISLLNVNNYNGTSVISLFDGTLSISNSNFKNIIIDSIYSFNFATISLTRGTLAISYSNFNNIISQRGGAIFLNDGSLSVYYSSFNNITSKFGSGVYINYGSLAIYYSSFYNNSAILGAAVFGSYCNAALYQITVKNCKSNHGNLYFLNSTVIIRDSSYFQKNNGVRGAAIYLSNSQFVLDNNNIFEQNSANEYSSIDGFISNAKIINSNIFKSNIQNKNTSSVGFVYSQIYIDPTNTFINQNTTQNCVSQCIQCIFDTNSLSNICNLCSPNYQLINNQCILVHDINNTGIIVLFIFSIAFIVFGGVFLFLKYKRMKVLELNQEILN